MGYFCGFSCFRSYERKNPSRVAMHPRHPNHPLDFVSVYKCTVQYIHARRYRICRGRHLKRNSVIAIELCKDFALSHKTLSGIVIASKSYRSEHI
jgi:hypothetical protein